MWKPTMATRLLLSLLLLLAMSTIRGAAAAGARGSPSWCVCRPDAFRAALQSTLDYACENGADCAPLRAGAQCHSPNTLLAHCSYAANSYFHKISRYNEDATCNFGGAATLSEIDPSSKTCTYPASAAAPTTADGTAAIPPAASKTAPWCVCKPGLSDAALQGTLDYACGHGADCDALRPGGRCHDPDTLLAHCSYAANSYFQSNKDTACDFAGNAALSSRDPSSGTCKYPATDKDNTMGEGVGKMPLWFLVMSLAVLVLCIVLLCLAECGSSTRATVSGGAVALEETGTTAAAAAEERPVTSTCPVCFDPCTIQGAHRICCLPCGHIYGRSCLESWLTRQPGNSRAKCPHCGRSFKLKDIINLYGQEVSSASRALEPAVATGIGAATSIRSSA